MAEDLEKLYRRFWEARQYKDRWLALYKELYFYVIPDRDAFNVKFNYRDDGKPVTQQIWDNTAMLAAYQRANDLHGLLLPKDRVWGKLVLDPHLYSPDLISNAQVVMDEINERIFFYLNESNLSRVVSSSNLDLVGGTGAIWVESQSDEVPLYFRSIAAVALYTEYSTDDVINTCWYAVKMQARDIVSNYPNYIGKLKETLIQEPDRQFTVNYGQIKYDEDNFYIYATLDDDPDGLLFDRESSYQQIIVYRDRVRPGEAEGRGIGVDMLPTIRDINLITMYSRQNMAFKANPPMFYDAGSYFNPYAIRQWAGAMIARNPQGRNPLEPLQMPTYPDVLQHIMHLQEAIQRGFQVDPLGEIQSPVRSATEVSIRENRAQRTTSTDISRLINELPKQIFDVAAKILNERGLLTKKRQSIPGFDTRKLKFDYVSPLYDLQNQADLNHLITNLQVKQQFFGQGASLASINLFEVQKFLTDKLNLPRKLFATDDDLRSFLKGLMQQQAQAQLPQPSPATAAGQVRFPEAPGVTI
jgi:Bacteriophage head to tail connecting protein